MTFKRLLQKMLNASSVTRLSNFKRIGFYGLLVAVGFCMGVTVNYFGLIFESIHVDVRVIAENASNLSPRTNTDEYVVPNIVHFIWFAPDNRKQLSFVNYISI